MSSICILSFIRWGGIFD